MYCLSLLLALCVINRLLSVTVAIHRHLLYYSTLYLSSLTQPIIADPEGGCGSEMHFFFSKAAF